MKLNLTENERKYLLKELTGNGSLTDLFIEQATKDKQYKNHIIQELQRND